MTEEPPAYGSIVHVELYSQSPDETAAFYREAFGWVFDLAAELEYTLFEAPAPPHGGLVDRAKVVVDDAPATLPYLYVESIETTSAAIQRAGGELLGEPVDIPDIGRIAVFRAPGDLVHALWQDADPEDSGAELPPDDPPAGSILHIELHSADPPATRRFYKDVFGWTFNELDDVDPPYELATMPSPPDGGLIRRTDGPFTPPPTLVYLLVDDVTDALSRIYHAGGQVLGERFEIEDLGAFGIFRAPGDIVQAVWERP